MSDLISKKAVIAKSHDIVIGEWRHRCVDAGVIMLMPEVDAIPVEWIEQYMETFHTGYSFTDWLVRIHIEKMVDNWQKEQRKEE